MKFQGDTLEEEVFRYDLPSGRYYAVGKKVNTQSMISKEYYSEPFESKNPYATIPQGSNPWKEDKDDDLDLF